MGELANGTHAVHTSTHGTTAAVEKKKKRDARSPSVDRNRKRKRKLRPLRPRPVLKPVFAANHGGNKLQPTMCITKQNRVIPMILPMTTEVTLSKSQLARLAGIEQRLAPLRQQLREHKLYEEFEDLDDCRRFMEMHVFAIWDFMSLMKSLQRPFASSKQMPWLPSSQTKLERLVQEMVMRYENDVNERGDSMSHFEMYLQAMKQLGADTKYITSFLSMLQACSDLKSFAKTKAAESNEWHSSFGKSVDSSLLSCGAPSSSAGTPSPSLIPRKATRSRPPWPLAASF